MPDKRVSISSPMPPRRHWRWPILIAVAAFALIILGGGGFVTATILEEHDNFCAACHTVPESTYYNRAYSTLQILSSAAPDLATAHYTLSKTHGMPDFSCISCHRGDSSLQNRVSTILLG